MVCGTLECLEGLRRANQATAQLLQDLAAIARPGVTTRYLDEYAQRTIAGLGAVPVFRTEAGFPACINTSINDVAVHGVPGDWPLRDGDVLSIDAGMLLDGYCGDATITVPIGQVTARHRRLIDTTYETMMTGIQAATSGGHIGDIGHAMQVYAEARGYGIVRECTGHGLGHRMHEEPSVPSVGRRGNGPRIPDGLVITIEPILVERSPRVRLAPDGWSMYTRDGGWAAQFEHTVIVTQRGAVILSAA